MRNVERRHNLGNVRNGIRACVMIRSGVRHGTNACAVKNDEDYTHTIRFHGNSFP
jgi:hypothetical protein